MNAKLILLLTFIFPMTLFSQADLVLSTAGFQPNSIAKGDIFSVQATVTNVGNITAGANYMFIYYSQDLTISEEEIISRVSIKELAPNESQIIDFIYPIPTIFTAGDYFLVFEIDPFDEVIEVDEDNLFCAGDGTGCVSFNVTNSIVYSQKFTYPIIFIHGLNSNNDTWNPFVVSSMQNYGWNYGGQLNYCLNPDNGNTSDTYIDTLTDASGLTIADFYLINFDPSNFGFPVACGLSNQASVVKQGWAVGNAVEQVLEATGSEKVILVGHSMGGLAAREYIQNPNNWQPDGEHHIAKLFTIATPNGGSNVSGAILISAIISGIDETSEAVRDLRYPNFLFEGQYLFGGEEGISPFYVNDDINCDGDTNDNIIGLNDKGIPLEINYSCMLDVGDEVVADDRADLNQYPYTLPPSQPLYADKFVVDNPNSTFKDHSKIHTEPLHFKTIIQGLDEPTFYNLAYPVQLNSLNYGYSTTQADNNPIPPPNNNIDFDDYKIEITENGLLEVNIWNIPVHGFALFLLDENYVNLEEVQAIGESNIGFQYSLTPGTYYIELASIPTLNSWRFPYAYSIQFTPNIPLVANFSVNQQEGCTPFVVNFNNQSTGDILSYNWTFSGGNPATSSLQNPQVTYNTSGTYDVSLTITDVFGNVTNTKNDFIIINEVPIADFDFMIDNATVQFQNTSNNGDSYIWDFGDGNMSNITSPAHTYAASSTYNAKLTSQNICGSHSITKQVVIDIPTSVIENGIVSEVKVFPNPNEGIFNVEIRGNEMGEYNVRLINPLGQTLYDRKWNKDAQVFNGEINVNKLPTGNYYLIINSEQESLVKKVVIGK